MNATLRSFAALVGATLIVAAGTLALIADTARGAPPGNVDIVGVDTDTTGNSALSLGTIDGCREGLSVGNTFDIDVYVTGVNAADGIAGAGYDILYDETVLQVNARDSGANIMFNQAAGSAYFDSFSEPLPDSDGDYRYDGSDVGGPAAAESGDGVVGRFTIEVVGAGTSTIVLGDVVTPDPYPDIFDANGGVLQPLQVGGGEVHADGTTCAAATPSPTPGATASPPPTEIPTDTPIPTPTPVPATATATKTPTPTSSTSTCNTELASSAAAGSTTITVEDATGCTAGDTIRIGSGSTQEDAKIASVSGDTITLVAALTFSHSAGESVLEVSTVATASATPQSGPATGAGSDGGPSSVLLIAMTLAGVAMLAVAGGSLYMARVRREE